MSTILAVFAVFMVGFFTAEIVDLDLGRPDFGSRQVKNLEDIHDGDYLLEVHRSNGSWSMVQVVKEPYWWTRAGKHGNKSAWRFDVLLVDEYGNPLEEDGELRYESPFLSDMGVIPYTEGWWNPGNAILRVSESELNRSSIQEILKDVLYK